MSNIKFDNDQLNAIHEEDNTIIIAGAGSGKTTTLVGKIVYLVNKKKINPQRIIMISFTNKATNELIKRINIDYKIPVKITTFHKLGLYIIRKTNRISIIRDQRQVLKNIIQTNLKIKDEEIVNLMIDRVNHYKEFFNPEAEIIKKAYQEYERYLKQHNLLDFTDMIIRATDMARSIDLNIDYLIIDEFQDISKIRFKLIEAIYNRSRCKLIVVGDDWQSIFQFAGSEISMFYQFKKIFNAKEKFIRTTYRNSQELVDIASQFIMNNKDQIAKKLVSSKHLEDPLYIKYYYYNYIKAVIKCLKHIDANTPVLLLGRYGFDINPILQSKKFKRINSKLYYKNKELVFLTIHTAKGLGYDNVILLNGDNKKYGFPARKAELNEERRLFYVALTRTKQRIYIVSNRVFPSAFVKEIRNYINVRILH